MSSAECTIFSEEPRKKKLFSNNIERYNFQCNECKLKITKLKINQKTLVSNVCTQHLPPTEFRPKPNVRL